MFIGTEKNQSPYLGIILTLAFIRIFFGKNGEMPEKKLALKIADGLLAMTVVPALATGSTMLLLRLRHRSAVVKELGKI